TEGGDRERQQEQQAAVAQREALRQRFDEAPAPPASDMEAVHEHGEALVKLAPPGLGQIHTEVDERVEIEQEAQQPCLPVQPVFALEEVAQGFLRVCAWDPLKAAAGRLRSGLHELSLILANRIGRICLNLGG